MVLIPLQLREPLVRGGMSGGMMPNLLIMLPTVCLFQVPDWTTEFRGYPSTSRSHEREISWCSHLVLTLLDDAVTCSGRR
jgi:hypothetical protein